MARVTSFTAERSLEIENGTVVHGEVNDEGRLILFRRDGQSIDAGKVSGATGDPGSGVSDIKVTYQASRSGIEEPTGIWEESVPTVPAGWYLWTRTIVTYMNPNDPTESFETKAFNVSRQGTDGSDGKDGADGRGIRDTTIQYQEGISSETPPNGNWLPNPPANLTAGRFLWTRTTIRYTDSSPSDILYSAAKQGSNGDKGSPGDPGKDGKTQYLHVAYANSSDGSENFSVSNPTGRSYMGTYSSFVAEDSTSPSDYVWSLIKGASGTGITSTVIHYLAGTSGTTPPTGQWATSVPTVPEGQFLWTRTTVNFTDGASQTAYSVAKQGQKGDKGDKGQDGNDGLPGKNGTGLVSTQVTYAQSTSGTVTPTSGWTAEVPTLIKGRFLWTRTVWVYSNDTTERGYSVAYVAQDGSDGNDGLPGKDGVGIANTKITYAKSSSGVAPPAEGWNAQPPQTVAGDYVWTRTVWTYTDNTTETGYSVGRIGDKGEPGSSMDFLGTLSPNLVKEWVNHAPEIKGSGEWVEVRRNHLSTPIPNETWSSVLTGSGSGAISHKISDVTGVDGALIYESEVTEAVSSSRVLRIFPGWQASRRVNVVPDEVFTASADLSISGASTPTQARVVVIFSTSTGSWVSEVASTALTVSNDPKSPSRVSLTVTIPSNAAYAEVVGQLGGQKPVGSRLTMSRPQFERSNTDYVYHDGNAPDYSIDPDMRQRWLGEPNASPSVMEIETVAGFYQNACVLGLSSKDGVPAIRMLNESSTVVYFSIVPPENIRSNMFMSGVSHMNIQRPTTASGCVLLTSPTVASYRTNDPGAQLLARIGNQGQTSARWYGMQVPGVTEEVSWSNVMVIDGSYSGPLFQGQELIVHTDGKVYFWWKNNILEYTGLPDPTNLKPGATVIMLGHWFIRNEEGVWVDGGPASGKDGEKGADGEKGSDGKDGKDGKDGSNGNDGLPGKDGVGLSKTEVAYAQSTSGTTQPSAGWTASVPTLVKGRFLWTRTIWTYTDQSTETGYSVAYVPTDGSNGNDGLPGKDGTGIKSTTITYAKSSNGTTPPTSGWNAQPPTTVAGDYVWTRTVWSYTDNTSETGYSVGRIGDKGDKGDKGSDGSDGIPGAPGTSVTAIDNFYMLSNSTPARPANTVVTPPSPWTLTQPTYTPGSSQNLYVTTRVTFSNNTRQYSAVSLDSAYAAAKGAHLKYEFDTRAPTNADGNGRPEGAMWVQKDSNGAVVGYWEWTGASWVKRPLSDEIIPLIRANMLSVDAMDGKLIQGATIRGGLIEQFKDSRAVGTYTHPIQGTEEVPTNTNQEYRTSVGTSTSPFMIVAVPSPDGTSPGCRAIWSIPSDYIGATIRVSMLVRRSTAGPVRVGEWSTTNNPTNVSANVWTRVNSPTFEFSGGFIAAQMDGGPELWATTPIVTVISSGKTTASLDTSGVTAALTFRYNDKVSGRYSPTGAQIGKTRDDGSIARTAIWPAQIELEEVMPNGDTNNAWITGISAMKNPLIVRSTKTLVLEAPTVFVRSDDFRVSSQPPLLDPFYAYLSEATSLTAPVNTWRDVSGLPGITITLGRPLLIRIDYGAMVKGTSGYTMIGINITGATVCEEMSIAPGEPAVFGTHTPFTQSTTDTSINGFKTIRLNPGTTVIRMRARRNQTGTHTVNYPTLFTTQLRGV